MIFLPEIITNSKADATIIQEGMASSLIDSSVWGRGVYSFGGMEDARLDLKATLPQ